MRYITIRGKQKRDINISLFGQELRQSSVTDKLQD